jgi:hypothetical protein
MQVLAMTSAASGFGMTGEEPNLSPHLFATGRTGMADRVFKLGWYEI